MSARYYGEGEWTVETEWFIAGQAVTIETRTLVDTRNGQRYGRGQYRVSGGGRARTYNGETAWCKAENDARDRCYALRML